MRNTGRQAGLIFLLMFIPGFLSMDMRGLSGSVVSSPDFLASVDAAARSMRWAIMFDLMATVLGVGVGLLLFRKLKEVKEWIAVGYLGLWLVQLAMSTMGNVGHLSLLELAQEASETRGYELSSGLQLGRLLVDVYFFAHWFTLIFFSLGAAILYYVFFKEKWLPAFIPLWGMVAVSIVTIATFMQIFQLEVSLLAYMQNGIFMLVLSLFLLVKGFPESDK